MGKNHYFISSISKRKAIIYFHNKLDAFYLVHYIFFFTHIHSCLNGATGYLNERYDWQNSMLFANENVGEKRVRLIRNSRPYMFSQIEIRYIVHTYIYIYIYTHSEGNQERSRMNRLIACALCAGEIKKVDFQVDASASNFPISIPNSPHS